MAIYEMAVIVQTLMVEAPDEQTAERVYRAYHENYFCPVHTATDITECGCVIEAEYEVRHTTRKLPLILNFVKGGN